MTLLRRSLARNRERGLISRIFLGVSVRWSIFVRSTVSSPLRSDHCHLSHSPVSVPSKACRGGMEHANRFQPESVLSTLLGVHVAFMLRGAADRFRKSLELKGNVCDMLRHGLRGSKAKSLIFPRCRKKRPIQAAANRAAPRHLNVPVHPRCCRPREQWQNTTLSLVRG